jgi:hypothetical protein
VPKHHSERLNPVVDHVDPRAIAAVAPGRARRWRRSASILLLPVAAASAGVIWFEVAHKLHKADPISTPGPPVVAGVAWSNRVFVDQAALKRWLAARHQSYAVWEREHPQAAAVLARRSRSR